MLKKANIPWWGFFIPWYNVYLLSKLAFKDGWIFLIIFLPVGLPIIYVLLGIKSLITFLVKLQEIIMFIYSLAFTFCLGKSFGRNGLITILFSFVVIPTIALSKKYKYE